MGQFLFMAVFHSFTLSLISLGKLCKKKKSNMQMHIMTWMRRNFKRTIALTLGIALWSIACTAGVMNLSRACTGGAV